VCFLKNLRLKAQVALRAQVASLGKRHVCHCPNAAERAWLARVGPSSAAEGAGARQELRASDATRKTAARKLLSESTERAKAQVTGVRACVPSSSQRTLTSLCCGAVVTAKRHPTAPTNATQPQTTPNPTQIAALAKRVGEALEGRRSGGQLVKGGGGSALILADGLEQWKDRLDEVTWSLLWVSH
jgi:hypothetical protein